MQGPPGCQDPDVPDVGMPPGNDDFPDLGELEAEVFLRRREPQTTREDRRPTYRRMALNCSMDLVVSHHIIREAELWFRYPTMVSPLRR